MALSATIYKASLQLSDLDRHFYDQFELVLARHPSETEQRLMLRLLAFVLHAGPQLQFTKGLCADDEPELWQHSDSGEIELWVELGTPDPKRLKKACGRAAEVVVYCYGDRAVPLWWQQQQSELQKYVQQGRLRVYQISDQQLQALAELAARNMSLTATLEDGQLWLSDDKTNVELAVSCLTD